ncbi:class I SAM-dependent methyltransferase [Candidatus Uabimicrobium amorphum]|uniref:Methyltransferase type 12 n=1 Tax=Uabimicrobium amorphum TaxID=2596890 RepID=A0A5S9F373_UABAM|nr:class I SAM-dependent methyltransferase [Candidatus Uabimicrobium amorphum]BBM84188.1 methyltransferase type 12 [Candidatus Uabimicrobium amorphum]
MSRNHPRFTTQTMWEIYQQLLPHLHEKYITFEVVNPDLVHGTFNGEMQTFHDIKYRYRSHKAWIDLAEIIDYRYLTPEKSDPPFIKIRYQNLNKKNSWHLSQNSLENKYGIDSLFARIDKLEEPAFLIDYADCLQKCNIAKNMRILGLGVNEGKEFKLFQSICSREMYESLRFLGIDIVQSSIDRARNLFPQNHTWMVDDIGNWQEWDIGKFDVLIAIGVFHSPSLNGKNIIAPLLKKFLHNSSKIILGFPNARYIDGEVKFGAKSKNYQKPEWSLLLKDIGYYRRLLFRQGFNVTVTGKYYLFVTGVK